jgi:hypothetical protein
MAVEIEVQVSYVILAGIIIVRRMICGFHSKK